MVSGLAPGSDAETLMVGKSTWGRGATGRSGHAASPSSAMAIISSEVATGRRMKGAERFMGPRPSATGAVAELTATLVPRRNRYWPLTTTRSPAFSPLVTTVMSPALGPASMGRFSTVSSGLTTQAKTPLRTPLHGGRGNGHGIFQHIHQNAHAHELARP